MKYSVFTDIDRTIIYSNKFINDTNFKNVVGVEKYKNKTITHVTRKQLSLIRRIRKQAYFIPTTARTFCELNRVDFIRNSPPKYMITTNGGKIYVGGVEDDGYTDYMELMYSSLVIQPQHIESELSQLMSLDSYKDKIKRVKLVDGMYVMIRFDNLKTDYDLVAPLIKKWTTSGYREFISHDKLYLIPYFVTKESAVRYVKDKYVPDTFSFGMGDTSMDYNFLKLMDFSLVPGHINFKDSEHKIDHISTHEGMGGGENILMVLLNKCNSLYC